MQDKKQQLELDMEQHTGSKSGKEYVKAVYCHPAYLTYFLSISCKMLGWMKHKLESRFSSVQSLRRVQLSVSQWTAVCQTSLSITNFWSLLKLMSMSRWCHPTISSSVIPPSHPLSLPSPPTFTLSQNEGLFKWVSCLHTFCQSIGVSVSVLPMNNQD